jgi:hypothetical protein
MTSTLRAAVLLVVGLTIALVPGLDGAPTHFPVNEVRPGMVATGETVFAGAEREPFSARVIGVLQNVAGPHRHLILARLEGGPLETTGVIAGMSGSPVYVDGRLLGAVAYSLGQFSKEPIAGITPIGEMIDVVTQPAGAPRRPLAVPTPLPVDESSLVDELTRRLSAGVQFAERPEDVRVMTGTAGPGAAGLRRIATPLALNGYSEHVTGRIDRALARVGLRAVAGVGGGVVQMSDAPLRGGDAVGVTLVSGDLAIAATGTVTLVDGQRVYAFGHPLVNLGPVTLPMTRAYIHTVLPSLLDSFKIASPGPVLGTLDQDRSTAISGTLGAAPRTIPVRVVLESQHGPQRRFAFDLSRDQTLTPTLAFFSVLSVLQSYEREIGGATFGVRGSVRVKDHGTFALDDVFAGDTAGGTAAGYVVTPLTLLSRTDLAKLDIDGVELTISSTEFPRTLAVERVWLDSGRVRPGDTVTARVALRPWRGAEIVRSVPITIPANAKGTLTLVVSDATRMATYDTRDLRQVPALDNVPQLMRAFASLRRNNVLYVRLVTQDMGAQVSGEPLTALPPSVLAIVEADRSGAGSTPLRTATAGSWDLPLDGVVVGQRQVTIPVDPD